MAEVLEILGPFHLIFPTSEVRLYVRMLRKCIRSRDSFMGSLVHAHVIKRGFNSDLLVSNVLLDMYAKAGTLVGCDKLFDEMPERDLISWCTLISGFVNHGFDLEAFLIFRRMCSGSLKPNRFVISSVLKACGGSRILELGLLVRGIVIKSGLFVDRFVEVGFVDMYAKCGDVESALKLFYEIPIKSPVAWNAMISGFVQNGYFIEGAKLCRDMCRVGLFMDLVTLRIVANIAAVLEMFEFCKNLHVYAIKVGLSTDSFVVAELVKLLTNVGEVEYMGKLFSLVKRPETSLYSLVISGYHLHGYREEAVKLAEALLSLDPNLREGDSVAVLNLCLSKGEIMQLHARVFKARQFSYLSVGNTLISLYSKIGEMTDAGEIFREMPANDAISWTTIMAGYVQNLQFGKALDTLRAFRKTGIQLDQYCLATIINTCTGLQDISKGKQIHSLVIILGLAFSDFITASLLHMYAKCGFIEVAAKLFSCSLSPQNIVLKNIMLSGYCWNSQPEKAVLLFFRECQSGLVPDQFTYSTALNACADVRAKEAGEQIHCCVAKSGFESSDVIVGNAIINLYMKCGCLANACKFFYSMKSCNTNSYAMLMLGYIQNRCSSEALQLFSRMQQSGLRANPVAFARLLRGCADLSAIDLGKQVHASIIKMGMVSDVYIDNALVGMYAKSAVRDEALETSEELSMKDDQVCDLIDNEFSQAEETENNLKAFGLFTLQEVEQNHGCNEDITNHNSSVTSKIFETFLPVTVIRRNLKFNSSVVNIMNKVNDDCMIEENNVFDKILAKEVVLKNSTGLECAGNERASVNFFNIMQEDSVISDQILLVVFFGDSYLKMFEKINSLKILKRSDYRNKGLFSSVRGSAVTAV
ncbi:Pentatricopeptide repeat-containing protein [Ananas comosus]|nr:Pentatricopeptide repeat-containing protein [Ananas comosus]